jgi:hypothetical protein
MSGNGVSRDLSVSSIAFMIIKLGRRRYAHNSYLDCRAFDGLWILCGRGAYRFEAHVRSRRCLEKIIVPFDVYFIQHPNGSRLRVWFTRLPSTTSLRLHCRLRRVLDCRGISSTSWNHRSASEVHVLLPISRVIGNLPTENHFKISYGEP